MNTAASLDEVKEKRIGNNSYCFYKVGSGNVYLLIRYDSNLKVIYELLTYSNTVSVRSMRCYNGTWGDWKTATFT